MNDTELLNWLEETGCSVRSVRKPGTEFNLHWVVSDLYGNSVASEVTLREAIKTATTKK